MADDGLGRSALAHESHMEDLTDLKPKNSQNHSAPPQKTAQHGSFTRAFDQKYDKSGYFGFENIGTPEGIEPGKISEGEMLSLLTKERSPNLTFSPGESSISQGRSTFLLFLPL